VRGRVAWDSDSTVGDFILLRSSGVPVYNFCVAGELLMLYTTVSLHVMLYSSIAWCHMLCSDQSQLHCAVPLRVRLKTVAESLVERRYVYCAVGAVC
jgi:hypothetical protein